MDDELFDLLLIDGRMSYHDLAERIGSSRAVVTARLNTLLGQGALKVVAAVHPEFLGINAIAHISVRTTGAAAEAMGIVMDWVEVVLVSVVSGAYDLVIEVRVQDQQALYATVSRLRALPGILEVNTLVYADVLRGSYLPRASLEPTIRVDEDDLRLIRLLQEDGRLSYRSLAASIGLSSSAVRNRVNNLLASNVIRIGASVDRRQGKNNVAAGFGLNITDDGSAVDSALRSLRGVEFLAETIGRYDLVATVAAESTSGLRQVAELLRALDQVVRVETWVHLETVKERYDWPLTSAQRPWGSGRASTRS